MVRELASSASNCAVPWVCKLVTIGQFAFCASRFESKNCCAQFHYALFWCPYSSGKSLKTKAFFFCFGCMNLAACACANRKGHFGYLRKLWQLRSTKSHAQFVVSVLTKCIWHTYIFKCCDSLTTSLLRVILWINRKTTHWTFVFSVYPKTFSGDR